MTKDIYEFYPEYLEENICCENELVFLGRNRYQCKICKSVYSYSKNLGYVRKFKNFNSDSNKSQAELIAKYGTPIGFRKGVPIYKAYFDFYHLNFFCPECKNWHRHGVSMELGHRVAHCSDSRTKSNAEKHPDGYYLLLVDDEEEF